MTARLAKLKYLQGLILVGAGFATLAASLGQWYWLLELFSHFRLQYIFVLLPMTLLYGAQRRWALMLVAALLCAVNVRFVASLLQVSPLDSRASLVVVSANLNSRNTNTDAVLALVRDERPDVLVVQELTPRWAIELATLEQTFPFTFRLPQEDNFGLALYSRWPLNNVQTIALGDSTPAVDAEVIVGTGPIRLIAVHLRPPMTPTWAKERTNQFLHLTELAATNLLPLVVVGDFNATPWSPDFRRWTTEAQLQNGQRKGGVAYTWPVGLPVLWIPIDACVVSTDLVITRQRRGPSIGSDHYPLVTSIWRETQS